MASLAACSTEGAETLVRPCKARHWVEQRAVGKGAQGRLESLPHIGHDTEDTEKKQTTEDTEDTEKNKPRRTRRIRRWEERGRTRWAAPTRLGGWRWSAQACGADGVGTPAQLGIVWLCRRDRRHGKPGGLLHLAAAAGGGARRRAGRMALELP